MKSPVRTLLSYFFYVKLSKCNEDCNIYRGGIYICRVLCSEWAFEASIDYATCCNLNVVVATTTTLVEQYIYTPCRLPEVARKNIYPVNWRQATYGLRAI
eukprot:TRINITY_DN15624_c1_g3_i1.p2 TRINITY_DN15624_c1_g3~~TRINITY_DN15624_c1_g3_i1.p2  ORF type:complete len:100 (+),score=7.39 TRINITY_DN15624_c1_g3_i1:33-332(+)